MSETLGPKEIDAILGKARADVNEPDAGVQRVIQPCNFRTAGHMPEEYARFMTRLFEAFARNASNALGASLCARFEMALASLKQVRVRDFLNEFQKSGFVVALLLQPGNTAVLMQIDTALVFPIIDLLLGGIGASSSESREITEIDEDIMEGVAQIICRQLEATWQQMGIGVRVERNRKATQVQSVFPLIERLTTLTFGSKLSETSGAVSITFPTSLASAMLREISADPAKKPHLRSGKRMGVRERVMACSFSSTMGIANLRIPLRDLVALEPGSILNLRSSVKNPASLILGGRELFEAVPVRSGEPRAAQLLRATGGLDARGSAESRVHEQGRVGLRQDDHGPSPVDGEAPLPGG